MLHVSSRHSSPTPYPPSSPHTPPFLSLLLQQQQDSLGYIFFFPQLFPTSPWVLRASSVLVTTSCHFLVADWKKKKDSIFGVRWGSARGDAGNSWVYQILSYPFSSHQVRTDKCGKFSTQGPSVLWVENVLEAPCFCGSSLAETWSLAGAVVGYGALGLAPRKGPECQLEVLLTEHHTGVLLGCTK